MLIKKEIPLLENILGEWQDVIGDDYLAYKNHVYRVLHFCFALADITEEDQQKLIIAACFHDIGLWTDNTVDYLPPSVVKANEYLTKIEKQQWQTEITLIIDMHHKIRIYNDPQYPLVELFRKADLIDFSLGLVKNGVSNDVIQQLKINFPNAGFHKMLIKMQMRWLMKHPFNPFPILKW